MKRLYSLILLLFIFTISTSAQLIRWVPYFAVDSDSITVTFNAQLGNGGLAGYTGDVYAHTGVITNLSTSSSDWKYVKTGWGVNTPETKLTKIDTDVYQYVIKPSVRAFYNVPVSEQILKIAFVFRSSASPWREGKTADGGDIFLNLATAGLNTKVLVPDNSNGYTLLTSGQNLTLEAQAAQATNIKLFVDNVQVGQSAGTPVTYNFIASSAGKKWIKSIATNGTATVVDSQYLIVRPTVTVQAVPGTIVDGINYTSNTTATLSLYAPGKQFVYVIGDFTNWEIDPALYMKKSTDGDRWWVDIPNLSPGTEYAFQYLVDGTLRVAEPLADKILDPWNDRYIPALVYPGLKQYPTGKTTNIVSVLQTAQTPYSWQITNFQKPAKQNLIIYETLLRDFSTIPSYRQLMDTLGYLKNLGINAIQLMPVMEFEGNESWGYNPMFFTAPDKYYGTKNDLKRLVDKAHSMGIAVILDIALNHAFGNCPLVRMWWDASVGKPAANSPYFNQDATHPYSVGYDFNHESAATKAFVDRVLKFWITEYKVDGFRFDLSKGFTQVNSGGNVGLWGQYDQSRINILKRIADVMWATDPSSYVILEHFADNSEETVLANYGMMLWGNHNFSYNEATMGYNGSSDFSWISWKNRGWSNPGVVGYMESHDEERLMYKNLTYGNSAGNYNAKLLDIALNRMKLAFAFFLPVPGPKMLWQFGELGYDISINYPCMTSSCRLDKKPLKWDYYTDPRRLKLYKTVAALAKLKVTEPVFNSSNFTMSVGGAMKRININHTSNNVVILGNFDVVSGQISPNFPSTGRWYEYFSGTFVDVTNTTANISLEPGELRMYSSVQFPAPEPGLLNSSDETNNTVVTQYTLEQNYPNPFNPSTTIRFGLPAASEVSLVVYDILGNVVAELDRGYRQAGIHEVTFDGSRLSSGIYFYQLKAGSFIKRMKLTLLK